MQPQIWKATSSILFTLAIGFAPVSEAAPKILSIDGDVKEGGSLTVTGTGFSNVNSDNVLYDLVSNQPEYQSLESGSNVPVDQGPWSQGTNVWGNQLTIVTSGDLRTPGTTSTYYGEVKSYIGWPRALSDVKNEQIYVSWWYKPNQQATNGGSNKFIRIWDKSGDTSANISLTQMHLTYGDGKTSWATTQPEANRWNRFEIYVDSTQKLITASLNGKVVQRVTDFQIAPATRGLTVALIGFDPSENNRYPNYSFRMKDIYVSPNQARVELSDSEVWDPASKREVLNPVSWSDQKITLDMNYFSHDPSDNLYIYVIDNAGNVTPRGIPLCEKCPGKPESVRIE